MTSPIDRDAVKRWFQLGLEAVDPERLTEEALAGRDVSAPTIIAIGKAAAAMCRGASQAVGDVTGVCVTSAEAEVPEGIELIIGDHPLPGPASYRAGARVLDVARSASGPVLALISGGGSALCELPRPGIDASFLWSVNSILVDGGASIEETNLVRGHLSAIKGGGVARAARGPVDTFVLSDVAGAGPEVVASGPTTPLPPAPEAARSVLERFGVDVTPQAWEVIRAASFDVASAGEISVVGDGRTAARAMVDAADADGHLARLANGWLTGPLSNCLIEFLTKSGKGVTIAAGEPVLAVAGSGAGGRNSHAALLAAQRLAGTQTVFAALASDGIDGKSDAAGAIVDGGTIARGGDPLPALRRYDSAGYLDRSKDLIHTGPTGTNVADLWVLGRT